jgi:hypothetical protein
MKIATLILSCFLAVMPVSAYTDTPVPTSWETHDAVCTKELLASEMQFWDAMVAKTGDRIANIKMTCKVIQPAIPTEDFIKLSMIEPLLTLFPDSIVPWKNMGTMVVTIKDRVDYDTKQIEFVKVMYDSSNGNLVFSRVLVAVVGR